jgi:hypothetical protein
VRVLLMTVLLGCAACTKGTIGSLGLGAGCVRTADCTAGTFCVRGTCQAIACATNEDCANGELCTTDGCVARAADAGIHLENTSIKGTGVGDRVDASNALRITGSGFATLDAVQLIIIATGEVVAELGVSTADATTITATLPQALSTASFPLTGVGVRVATFAAGSVVREVQVLKGEDGQAGPPGAGLPDCPSGSAGVSVGGGWACSGGATLPTMLGDSTPISSATLLAENTSASSSAFAIVGTTTSANGAGVWGHSYSNSQTTFGVVGSGNQGVLGITTDGVGVHAVATNVNGSAIEASNSDPNGIGLHVDGVTELWGKLDTSHTKVPIFIQTHSSGAGNTTGTSTAYCTSTGSSSGTPLGIVIGGWCRPVPASTPPFINGYPGGYSDPPATGFGGDNAPQPAIVGGGFTCSWNTTAGGQSAYAICLRTTVGGY